MSTAQQGVVAKVSEKEWDGTTLYSFQLAGSNDWYRTGEDAPNVVAGQKVKFTFNQRGNSKKVDMASLKRGPVGEAPSAPAPRRGGAGGARNDYWEDKAKRDVTVTEPRISWASAQHDAVTLVSTALSNDCLSLGSKKADRLDILLDTVEEVTQVLFERNMNAPQRSVAPVKDAPAATQEAESEQQEEDGEDWDV